MEKNTGVFGGAMLILGATIGAGLASGQEVVIFFAKYGFVSIFYAFIFFILFAYGLLTLLKYGQMLKNKPDFLTKHKDNFILESCFAIIFLIFSATMLTGAESLLNDIVYCSKFHLWSILIMLLSLIIISKDLKWLISINKILVPIIIISTILVCAFSFTVSSQSDFAFTFDISNFAFLTISTILYAACNLMVNSKIAVGLGTKIKEKNIKKVAIITSFIIFVIIATIILTLLLNDNSLLFADLPLVYLAFMINPTVGYIYSFIILACILTTLFATFYSLKESVHLKVKSNFASFLISAISIFILSLFGFESIIRYSYPIIGAIGIIMIFNIKNRMACSDCECSCEIKTLK